MAIGWMIDVPEAIAYFYGERLATDLFDNADDLHRTKALMTAYNRIIYDSTYTIPPSPTPAELVKLKKAQCELSYYILEHQADEDRRKGLQAQGVIQAGIVKEVYFEDWLDKLAVPPFVDAILEDFKKAKRFHLIDIDRDEDKSAKEEVADF
jgi:hypothetical protein